MQHLPAAAIIEACPGGDRPGVVQLPVKRAHAMRFQRAPCGDGGVDGKALLHLGQIDEVREIHRKAEIAEHGFRNPRIAARVLLVAFHHGGGDVEIGGIGEVADHRISAPPKVGAKRSTPGLDVC